MSIRLSKIYTKTGDEGTTALISGIRVAKHHLRIQAIGDIDEANAALGVAATQDKGASKKLSAIRSLLLHIQNDLFDLGADIALPLESEKSNALRIVEDQVTFLEKQIDLYNEPLDPLTSFVLPGGSPFSAALHLARTITRRAERSVVELNDSDEINPLALQYLNRLSDLLFVLAREGNDSGKQDILWKPGANRSENQGG